MATSEKVWAKGRVPELMDVQDLAAYMGVSKSTMYGIIRSPRFPEPIFGTLRSRKQVDAWLESGSGGEGQFPGDRAMEIQKRADRILGEAIVR